MSCTQCNGEGEDNRSYDRGHEQEELSMGAWRWASRCPTCGTMVYEPVERTSSDRFICVEPTTTKSTFSASC